MMADFHSLSRRLRTGALLTLATFVVLGCDKSDAISPSDMAIHPSSATSLFGVPAAAVAVGRTKATKQFIAKKWQVVSVNRQPIVGNLVFDLSDFESGKGEFYDGCERILVDLNTHDVSNEKLAVDKSVRHHSACDSELIENIMWLLSDIYAFERENEDLLIIATQDTIRLTPIK